MLPFQPLHALRLSDPKKNDDAHPLYSDSGSRIRFSGYPVGAHVVSDAAKANSSDSDARDAQHQEHFLGRFPFAPLDLRHYESNAASAAFVGVSSICLDALSSTPPTVVQDVPSALRCSAFVILACIGAPIILFEPNPNSYDIELEQRTLLLVVLAIVAFYGEHTAGVYVRVVDAIFCLLAGWVMVGISMWRSTKSVPGSSLCGGIFVYCGCRVVRAGLVHSSEVVRFSVSGDSFETLGYAVADSTISTALVFGGSIVTCTGLLILVNDHQVHETGSYSIAPIVSMNAGIAFAAAFIAQLAVYSRLEDLSTLFGPEACNGAESACEAAFRARRFHVANTAPSALWAIVVAMTVYSLPRKRRCPNRDDYYVLTKLSTASGAVAAIVSASCVVAVFVFATSDMVDVQVELVLLYVAIPTAWFVSVPAACALSIGGQIAYMASKADGAFGYDWDYFTNWSLAASALITALLFVTTVVSRCLWAMNARYWLGCEHASGILIISLLSIQTALTLATLALVVGYDGTATTTEEISWRKSGFEFSIQHSLSFFLAAAIYGARYEVGDPLEISPWTVSPKARRRVWYALPPLLGFAWWIRLLIAGYGSPYSSFTSAFGLAVGLVAAIVPWLVVGWNV